MTVIINNKENSEQISQSLTLCITYLVPKTSEANNPKNYRPFTCLSTTHKLLPQTCIISERAYSFLQETELLPHERPNSYQYNN